MKKLISIILAVSVFVSAFSFVSLIFVSAEDTLSSQSSEAVGYYEVAETPIYESPATGNWKDWFFIDTALSASNASAAAGSGSSADGRVTLSNGPVTSTEILDRNHAVKTELTDFEWQFTFAGIGQMASNQVDFYMFHVNDDSDYEAIAKYDGGAGNAGFAEAENLFVIARSRRDTNDGLKQNAFTILQPTFDEDGNSLGLRPISYTESGGKIVPEENAYMSIPGTDIADINTFMTIKATLKGSELTLTLSIDPTRNQTGEWYTVEKTFTLSDEALKAAPSGDFVVSSAKRASGTGTVCHYKNMTVKEIKLVSSTGSFGLNTTPLFKASASRKQWLTIDTEKSSGTASVNSNEGYDGRNVIYDGKAVSMPILAAGKSAYPTVTTTDVDDFIWRFEYASTGGNRDNLISFFMFHVNEDSEYSKLTSYNGQGGDGIKAGLDDMSNVFAIAYAYDKTDDGLAAQAFTVLQPTVVGGKTVLRPISYTEESGVVIPDESAYLSYSGTSLAGNRHNWSSITAKLEGNRLTLTVQGYTYDPSMRLEKTFTLSDEALKMAPSGDFAVSCGDDFSSSSTRAALFKNMSIYNYGYSQYTEGLTFEKSSTSNGGRVTLQDGKVVLSAKTATGGDARMITKGITGKELADYTLKYNYIPAGTRWILDAVVLRAQDGETVDRNKGYIFAVQGTQHKIDGVTPNKSSVWIRKDSSSAVTNSNINVNTVSWDSDFAITEGTEYTVEITVSGGTVKVWMYKATDTKPSSPTLTYTDPNATYKSGDIAFYTYGEGSTVSNITITDSVHGTICENWNPGVYNSAALNVKNLEGTGMNVGTVTTADGKLTAAANNSVTADVYPVSTNGLFGKNVENFAANLTVSLADLAENDMSVSFSAGEDSGYKLTLKKSASGSNVTLYKDGTVLGTAAYELKAAASYNIQIAKQYGDITVDLWLAGKDMPASPIIKVTDTDWLAAGDLWFSTDSGEFTVYNIETTEGTAPENSALTNEHTKIGESALTFEKSTADGLVSLRGGRVMISAMNADGKSTWVTTKGITGKQLTDYTLKYSYIVASNTWTADAVALRIQDSENADRAKGYTLVIQGLSFTVDGEKPAGSIVSIQKDGCTVLRTAAIDTAKQSMTVLDSALTIGTEYTVEITVKGATVSAWIYKATDTKPSAPTVTYTDPEAKYTSGDIAFVARDEGFTVSDITVTDSALGTVCENWEPAIYNTAKALNVSALAGSQYQTGTVNYADGAYRMMSNNTVNDETYSVATNGIDFKNETYLKNFELVFELNFDDIASNTAVVNFATRDYTDDQYSLVLSKNDAAVTLTKNGQKLGSTSYGFRAGVKYQVILSVKNGAMNVTVYRMTGTRPSSPTLTCTDPAPLASGLISFSSDSGSFRIGRIGIRSFDAATSSGPTGLIFQKDFEDEDYNLDGLAVTLNNTEHTTLNTDEDGNGYLRIVGKPSAKDKADVIDGTNALSQVKFGSDELRNFDLSAKVRFKAAFSANWSYLAVGAHANPSKLRNQAIWLDAGVRGAAVIYIDTADNKPNSNVVATTGSVKGTGQTSFVPNEAEADGIPFDGKWHELAVSVREHTYSLYIDGELILSYTDPTESYEKGSVYLYGYGINYDLDDILLTNYSGYAEDSKPINNTVYTNETGFKLKEMQKTSKLTGKKLSEFEWEFEYKAQSSNWGRTAFLFRVNDKSSVVDASSNYSKMTNVFGFTITGTNISTKTNEPNIVSGIRNNGITVFYPNTDALSDGNILPVVYTQEKNEEGKVVGPVIPTYTSTTSSRAAMDFAEVVNATTGAVTSEAIDVGQWMTVNARFVGNKLSLTVWQTDNKAKTVRRQLFTLPMDAVNNITEGDLMIVNGNNGAQIRNITVRDVSVLKNKTASPASAAAYTALNTAAVTTATAGASVAAELPKTGDSRDLTPLKLVFALSLAVTGLSAFVLFRTRHDTAKHAK